MSHPTPVPGHSPTEAEFIEVQASEEFADLRKTFRGFVLPLFVAFIVITLTVVVRATRQTSQKGTDFYTGGASFNGTQNGLAIAGDYLSAAAFLGVTGAIAVQGYDGFLYSVGFLIALLVALVLVAEPLRNTGRFTMADVLSFRLNQKPVRTAAAIPTLTISLFYLIAQMAGAGGLVALLLGIDGGMAQYTVVAIVGALMIIYVLVGGMKGTTYVQMIKAVLLVGGSIIIAGLTFWALKGGFNELLGVAVANHPDGEAILKPGLKYGGDVLTQLDFVSLGLALVFGTAGLPHVLMRFYTVPTAREARRSVTWTIGIVALFFLLTVIMGYGAAALVGKDQILSAPGGVNSAVLLLAAEVGGTIFMAIILGIGALGQNIAFLVALAFGIAAAANLPTIIGTLVGKPDNLPGKRAEMEVRSMTGIGAEAAVEH
ncbi:hypothetical protein [Corynebacterium xerosis]|uniref:sodium:solute symporter family transporter n=1 Tax=Corynebacterium xerosis TaxID=1725 RepID=UPI00366E5389